MFQIANNVVRKVQEIQNHVINCRIEVSNRLARGPNSSNFYSMLQDCIHGYINIFVRLSDGLPTSCAKTPTLKMLKMYREDPRIKALNATPMSEMKFEGYLSAKLGTWTDSTALYKDGNMTLNDMAFIHQMQFEEHSPFTEAIEHDMNLKPDSAYECGCYVQLWHEALNSCLRRIICTFPKILNFEEFYKAIPDLNAFSKKTNWPRAAKLNALRAHDMLWDQGIQLLMKHLEVVLEICRDDVIRVANLEQCSNIIWKQPQPMAILARADELAAKNILLDLRSNLYSHIGLPYTSETHFDDSARIAATLQRIKKNMTKSTTNSSGNSNSNKFAKEKGIFEKVTDRLGVPKIATSIFKVGADIISSLKFGGDEGETDGSDGSGQNSDDEGESFGLGGIPAAACGLSGVSLGASTAATPNLPSNGAP